MDLTRSEEQAELATIVRSLLEKRSDSGAVRAAIDSEAGYDTELWATMCEQIGVAALNVPEDFGGAGYSLAESVVVLEEIGRSLAPTPLLASLIASEALIAVGGDAAAELLPRIAAGEIATVAFGTDAFDTDNVLYGAQADIVLAIIDGAVVTGSAQATPTPAVDLTAPLASISLDSPRVLTSDQPALNSALTPALDRIRDVALVGAAALQVGTMQRALDDTVAYTKERVQFGRTIGSFQALKHRMADMLVRLEMSRSALLAAAWALAHHADDASERAAVAASYCAESLSHIAAEMVQLHGGIAITWEHDAHLVFKRAHLLGTIFGQPHEHRTRISL